jgi:hypothetical protein
VDFGSAVKDLGSGPLRFVYSWVLPSGLSVSVYFLVVAPPSVSNALLRSTNTSSFLATTSLIVVAGLTVATSVALLSLPIYRFLEGYTMPRWLARRLRRRQLVRRRRLQLVVARQIGTVHRVDLAGEQLDLYPEHSADVLPTRLGNGLKAFERYGSTRFGLDSQALWYELLAVAPAAIRTEIDETRSPVDFFISGVVHLVLLASASLVTGLILGGLGAIVVGLASAALIPVAYFGAVQNLGDYSSAVKALVNLGRVPLAPSLGLRMPESAELEREMWEATSELVEWQSEGREVLAKLDRFRAQPSES